VTATETLLRARVKSIVETEFSAEGVTVENDKLTRASGRDGRTRVACSPDAAGEAFQDVGMLEVNVLLQYYLPFNPQPDENYVVDPAPIEDVAERLRTAFRANSSGTTDDLWFLRLASVTYPDDPTGNKSRLEARIIGRAANDAGLSP
jgi:hypothetical protein